MPDREAGVLGLGGDDDDFGGGHRAPSAKGTYRFDRWCLVFCLAVCLLFIGVPSGFLEAKCCAWVTKKLHER